MHMDTQIIKKVFQSHRKVRSMPNISAHQSTKQLHVLSVIDVATKL